MKRFKMFVSAAAVAVLLICVHSFFLGSGIYDQKFTGDGIAWYFLAKGIFCSLTLYLLVRVLESLPNKKES